MFCCCGGSLGSSPSSASLLIVPSTTFVSPAIAPCRASEISGGTPASPTTMRAFSSTFGSSSDPSTEIVTSASTIMPSTAVAASSAGSQEACSSHTRSSSASTSPSETSTATSGTVTPSSEGRSHCGRTSRWARSEKPPSSSKSMASNSGLVNGSNSSSSSTWRHSMVARCSTRSPLISSAYRVRIADSGALPGRKPGTRAWPRSDRTIVSRSLETASASRDAAISTVKSGFLVISCGMRMNSGWCERGDSNPHGENPTRS